MNNAGLYPDSKVLSSRILLVFRPLKSLLSPFIFAALFSLIQIAHLEARSFRIGMIPNAPAGCNTCHTTGGGTPLNPFGLDVETRVTPGGGEVFWGPALAALDSDGDGIANGVELGDPLGTGSVDPLSPITHPGDPTSVPPRPPALEPIGDRNVAENEPLSFQLAAVDPDGGDLSFIVSGNPPGSTLVDDIFSWTPGFEWAGGYLVTFSAADGAGHSASETIVITVTDVNRAPLLESIGNQAVAEGGNLSLSLAAVDPDGDGLSFIVSGNPPGSTLVDNIFSWMPTSDQSGVFALNFRVEDGRGGEDSETIVIQVNIPPLPCVFSYDLSPGWSMISLPCQLEDAALEVLFPTAISLFEFTGGYRPATNLTAGKAYWINLPTSFVTAIAGEDHPGAKLEVPAGWSMVGPGNRPVDGFSLGDGVVSIFGFAEGYFPAAVLEPGRGYWVNMNAAGQLDLSGGGAPRPSAPVFVANEFPGGVLWCRAEGWRQELLLGVEEASVVNLPPLPPAGVYDARVEIGEEATAWQVPWAAMPRHYRMQIQGGPMHLGWQIPPAEEGQWHLLINGQKIDLRGSGEVVLEPRVSNVFLVQARSAVGPQRYALEQNYPNPFNSTTEIRFALPAKAEVELGVYNLAGQKVATLAAGVWASGIHSINWSGRDEQGRVLGSGVYLYRLRAGTHFEVRKMALLK